MLELSAEEKLLIPKRQRLNSVACLCLADTSNLRVELLWLNDSECNQTAFSCKQNLFDRFIECACVCVQLAHIHDIKKKSHWDSN